MIARLKRDGLPTGSHRDEQHRQRRNNGDSEEILESTEGGWTDYLIRVSTSVWNQEPRLQRRMAVNWMVKQLCREEDS